MASNLPEVCQNVATEEPSVFGVANDDKSLANGMANDMATNGPVPVSGYSGVGGLPPEDRPTNSLSTVEHATTCERCVALERLLREAEAANVELGQRTAGLELQLRRAGSAEVALRRELDQQREDDPKSKQIRGVLNHWKRTLDHPRAKTPITGKRAKVVRVALRNFTEQELMQALDGLAKLPYVGAGGRKAQGQPHERFDDVEHALRDEATIERFIGYATTSKPQRRPVPIPTIPAVDRLLERLDAVKRTGSGWTAKCPGHDDRHASLSVAQGRKGVVATCHAGCEPQRIADAIGMPLAEWFDPEAPPILPPEPLPSEARLAAWQRRLMAHRPLLDRLLEIKGWTADTLQRLGLGWNGSRIVFPTRDHAGELVSVALYLPAGNPKMLGLRGHERGLFPAPETLNGSPDVWLVEGEPDAVTGQQHGLPTIGVPGVNGWRDGMAQRLWGRDIVICLDADDPGRAAASRIAGRLVVAGFSVRLVDLDETRDDGYDLSDAIREGATAEILQLMASQAPVVQRDLRLAT